MVLLCSSGWPRACHPPTLTSRELSSRNAPRPCCTSLPAPVIMFCHVIMFWLPEALQLYLHFSSSSFALPWAHITHFEWSFGYYMRGSSITWSFSSWYSIIPAYFSKGTTKFILFIENRCFPSHKTSQLPFPSLLVLPVLVHFPSYLDPLPFCLSSVNERFLRDNNNKIK